MNVTKLVEQVLEITRLNTVFETYDEPKPQPLVTYDDRSAPMEVEMVSCD